MTSPVRPILFLHLPKAAGTTLKSIIERVYGSDRVAFLKAPRGEVEAFGARPVEERTAYDAVAGHMTWGDVPIVPGAHVITMLRDPIERLLSWFHYQQTNPNAKLHDAFAGLSFEDAVRRSIFPGQYNQMTDRLRDPDVADAAGAVASARKNLASCAAFGLSERFAESVAHFGRVLRWPETEWSDLNVSEGRPRAGDLDRAILAHLRRACGPDYELYDFARRLFDQRVG
ncbi:MAG: sulfotransferase family 2 domain-containing protein [Phycisphaeraceae bacterium]|nr:MAG: sulfotransferase family 2 domain-containing protein [Phycisphaeraceae bacterium]